MRSSAECEDTMKDISSYQPLPLLKRITSPGEWSEAADNALSQAIP